MTLEKKLDHVQLIQLKNFENSILIIVDLILDLEAIYLENFKNGLLELDWDVIRRCKTKLSLHLEELGLYNLFLDEGDLHFISDENDFSTIKEIPRIKLNFKPRAQNFAYEDPQIIKNENDAVLKKIELICKNLKSRDLSNIQDVRKKYVTDMDGFTFTLRFTENAHVDEVLEKINSFKEEVENLTLEELMVAQQFTDFFKVDYTNPFWIEKEKITKNQTIMISLRNIETSAPFHFFSTIILNINNTIKKRIDSGRDKKNKSIKIFLSYNSINQSHIAYNLNLEI